MNIGSRLPNNKSSSTFAGIAIVIIVAIVASSFQLFAFGIAAGSSSSTSSTSSSTTMAVAATTSTESVTSASVVSSAMTNTSQSSTTIFTQTTQAFANTTVRALNVTSNSGNNDSQPIFTRRMIATKVPRGQVAGVIVPLYTRPSDVSWKEVAQEKSLYPFVPIIAIINPANGPGSGPNEQWTDGIKALRTSGIEVVGYVATGYGSLSIASVEAQVQNYSSWYKLDGIFFDEMASSNGTGNCPFSCTMQQYYRALVVYSAGLGYRLTIGNPGGTPDMSFNGIMSVLVIYEGSGSAAVSEIKNFAQGNKSDYGYISIGVGFNSTEEKSYSNYVGWIYMTDYCTGESVNVCNPYDGLPSYFGSLVSSLSG